MSSNEQGTKEKILTAALEMFSVNGFTAVSIRDIGKVVGIKESSIYYHFRNKEDILQSILDEADKMAQIRKDNFNEALQTVSTIKIEEFVKVGIAYVNGYLLEERIHKLLRMLMIEKQRNEKAAAIYQKLLFTAPVEHHKNVFSYMMDIGCISKDHPDLMAVEYQSIILFIFNKYFSGPEAAAGEVKAAALNELTILLNRFFARYSQDIF